VLAIDLNALLLIASINQHNLLVIAAFIALWPSNPSTGVPARSAARRRIRAIFITLVVLIWWQISRLFHLACDRADAAAAAGAVLSRKYADDHPSTAIEMAAALQASHLLYATCQGRYLIGGLIYAFPAGAGRTRFEPRF